jgi:hypothetical protein
MKRTDRFAFQIDLFVGLVRAARVNLAGRDNEETLARSAPGLTSRDDGSGDEIRFGPGPVVKDALR